MLEFISDSESIETKAGNVVLKKKSPLFTNESIEGEITFPFTIPMTDELRRWLNFPDRIETLNKLPSKRIQLKRNGNPILIGDLKLGDADEEMIETTLITGSSPFAALIKDVSLDELDLGFQIFSDEADLLAYWNGSISGNCFSHPYYLPSIVSTETGYLNYYWKSVNSYLLEVNSDKTFMTPMLYYSWLLPKIFESLGYEFEDRVFINDADLQEMLFFNMHNINNQEDILTIHFADLLPHYKLSTWLIDIQNLLHVRFLFDNNRNKVVLDWLNTSLNNATKAQKVYHDIVKLKTKEKNISSFHYNLADAQAIWEPTNEDLLPSVWEKKDLPKPTDYPNKYCYVVEEDILYQFRFDSSQGEYIAIKSSLEYYNGMRLGGYYNNFVTNFSVGDNSEETQKFNSNIHPLHTLYVSGLLKNYTYLEEDRKLLSPYVLFATHTIHDTDNYVLSDFFSGKVSFLWYHQSWLMQNKILPWWQFLRDTKPVETNILLSDVALMNWDWTIPLKINNIPCLVAEMEIPLSAESELMKTKVKAYIM